MITIIIWIIGFIGGLSLGAILSANDENKSIPIVYVLSLIISVSCFIVLMMLIN